MLFLWSSHNKAITSLLLHSFLHTLFCQTLDNQLNCACALLKKDIRKPGTLMFFEISHFTLDKRYFMESITSRNFLVRL